MSSKNNKEGKPATKPEKGEKGKKGKKKLEIKLSKVEETFYQLTVADCEKKINNLRQHLHLITENNNAKTEQIRSLREDNADEAVKITNKVKAADEKIFELNEKIQALSGEYFQVKRAGDAKINDLEEKYNAMHDQLSSEVKELKARLNVIEEYPKIAQKLNRNNEMEELRREQKEMETKELIQSTERRIKGEREAMRKEIERKLLHVSEEFTRSITLRNAAYTQRLTRENIALAKEINILNTTWQSTDQQLREQVARHKEVKATFPALKEKKRKLIMIAQQKTELIEQLTSKYEKIKAAYVESLLYKTQYEDLVEYQLCRHFQRKELMNKAKNIGRNAHSLKTDCLQIEAGIEKNKHEIENLKGVIGLIRETVLKTIGVLGERSLTNKKKTKKVLKNPLDEEEFESEEEATGETDNTSSEEDILESAIDFVDEVPPEGEEQVEPEDDLKVRTQSLLETLYNILSFYKLHKTTSTSLETISADHLLRQHSELYEGSTASLREAYKHGVASTDVVKKQPDQLAAVPQLKQTIPTERSERCPLFDIEKGSTLYVSISESNKEIVAVEAQPTEDQDEVSESFSSNVMSSSEEEPKKAESKSKLSLSEMPAGTILDVEMADESEEEDEVEFDRDIYLADRDQEHDQYMDGGIEEDDEEEMPFYMFY